jgi:hypothetical protein
MERKLLQIAFASAGLVLVVGLMIDLAGELIFAPLLWLWQRHVARVALRRALS